MLVGIEIPVIHAGVEDRPAQLAGDQVRDIRLEEGAGSQDLAERHCVPLEFGQGALQVFLAIVEDLQYAVEFVQRRLELGAVVVDESGDLVRDGGQTGHQGVDRIPFLQQRHQQRVGIGHQGGDLLAAPTQHAGDVIGIAQQVAQLGVTVVQGVREPCHPLQGRPQIRRCLFEGVRQCC
ncbi:hypothetical protein IWGMT90018_21680 [Mycobacterium kiyosense]|nr:hypothetical protein IWGMT90018_21680 [Mycobacterium kiyosense]